ncbi:MAG: LysR family transcriptional regulator [Bdellovibrionales bacterium]|jgi:DNA-binding transcriptional LysR family regulator|nr:LysR family transcriptional regulator [Bdellovibrionales bacterium]
MDLNEILVFVRVVQAGSFNKAALTLGMPNSTVSTKVSVLEKRLGVTLLHRTTRKQSLTEDGDIFYRSVLPHIEGLLAAEEQVSFVQAEPIGTLRMTAPSLVASYLLPSVIAKYVERFPKVNVELIATDAVVDLVGERLDLAIRAGKLADSSLKMKKIGTSYFALFASPRYLKGHDIIRHPKDLLQHQCVQFSPLGKDQWDLQEIGVKRGREGRTKSRVSVHMTRRLLLDELHVVKELILKDHGIALLPTFVCDRELSERRLVRVLPNWCSEGREMSLVYPKHRFASPKLSSFLDLAALELSRVLEKVSPATL